MRKDEPLNYPVDGRRRLGHRRKINRTNKPCTCLWCGAKLGNNILDSPEGGCHNGGHDSPGGGMVPPWAVEPHRLWSLLDIMIELHPNSLFFDLTFLAREIKRLESCEKNGELSEKDYKRLEKRLFALQETWRPILDEKSHNRFVTTLLVRLVSHQYNNHTLSMYLNDLKEDLESALTDTRFVLIPPDRSQYFNQEDLFGSKVKKAFPSAQSDITEAGNCFASGAFTATVFHLMRAAEIALRVLARDLNTTFTLTLEYEEWNTILDNIQSKANDRCANEISGRKQKSDAREFYNGAIGEFRAFKDAWRNHVMHTRSSYDELTTQSVMNHVREFMQRLAEKLQEGRKKPIKW